MKKSLASALLAVSMLANTPAYAAEQTIHVELNKTETKGDACRVYMIVGNESGRALETLKPYLTNPDTVIGKKLTVRYQGLTNGGVPRFPIGASVRDYE